MTLDTEDRSLHGITSSFALWYGVLAGPVVWLIHLFVSYGLATILCTPGQIVALHSAAVAASLIALSSGVVGWRARSVLTGPAQPSVAGISLRRARFLANFAIGNGSIFLLAIVAQSLPNFFLDPCRALA